MYRGRVGSVSGGLGWTTWPRSRRRGSRGRRRHSGGVSGFRRGGHRKRCARRLPRRFPASAGVGSGRELSGARERSCFRCVFTGKSGNAEPGHDTQECNGLIAHLEVTGDFAFVISFTVYQYYGTDFAEIRELRKLRTGHGR